MFQPEFIQHIRFAESTGSRSRHHFKEMKKNDLVSLWEVGLWQRIRRITSSLFYVTDIIYGLLRKDTTRSSHIYDYIIARYCSQDI